MTNKTEIVLNEEREEEFEDEDWDRSYPPEEIDWVDDDMKEIQREWILWNKYENSWGEIGFGEGQFTMNEGDPENEYREKYQEVCIAGEEMTSAIGDDFVYYSREDAMGRMFSLWKSMLTSDISFGDLRATHVPLNIMVFKHGDNFSPAVSVEWFGDEVRNKLHVNVLGFGVFVRRELLERLGIPYHRFYKGESNE